MNAWVATVCLALVIVCVPQVGHAGSPVVVSFEQSEGFPAPVLVPDMAPGGIRNPYFNFTGFAGGPNSGYAGHPNGPVPEKPPFSTNNGLVTNWGAAGEHFDPNIATEARQTGTWFIDDGPGGLNLLAGSVPSCLGPPASCNPAPVSGSAMAGVGFGMEGGVAFPYAGLMDLDNSQNISLKSFHYANRGNGPPRLLVEYYGLDESLLGVNSFSRGDKPNVFPCYGCGLGLENFEPAFQLIEPTPPFQDVPLSKVIFRSFHDADSDGEVGGGHGMFFMDDITLQPNSSGVFLPGNFVRVSFEENEGFPDGDGQRIDGSTALPSFVTAITNLNPTSYSGLQVDHGPDNWAASQYGGGDVLCCGALDEDDPIFGEQAAFMNPTGIGDGPASDAKLEIDLDNDVGLSLASFWYAYRGNGSNSRVTVQYFGLDEQSLGSESFTGSPDGGVALGLGPEYEQDFDQIVVGNGGLPTVRGTPMSKIIITSAHQWPEGACGGPCQAAFGLDDLLFQTVSIKCDMDGNSVCDAADIDLMRAAINAGTSDSKFNVDGVGGSVPNMADLIELVTGANFFGTQFGDSTLDRIVDANDLVEVRSNTGQNAGWAGGNFDLNNIVDNNDVAALRGNFGFAAPLSSPTVPEPGTAWLLSLLPLVGCGRRWGGDGVKC